MRMLIVFLIMLLMPATFAEEPYIIFHKSVDKEIASVGEPIRVTLYVENVGTVPTGNFRIVDQVPLPGYPEKYVYTSNILYPNSSIPYYYSFFSLKEGNYTLPPAELIYYDSVLKEEITLKTETAKVQISPRETTNITSAERKVPSDVGNASATRYLYPTYKKDVKIGMTEFSILGILISAFLGIVTYAFLTRKKKFPKASTEARKTVANKNTFDVLVKAKELFYSGKINEAFDEISSEMKRLISDKYKINEELTTDEYLRILKDKMEDKKLEKLKSVLEFCDFVKFAGYAPASEEFQEIVLKARELGKSLLNLPN